MQDRKPEIEMAYLSDSKTLNVARLEYTQKLGTEYTALNAGGVKYDIINNLNKKFNLGTDIVFLECEALKCPSVLFIANLSKGIFILRPLSMETNYVASPEMRMAIQQDLKKLVAKTGYYHARKLTSQFDKPSYDGKTGQLELNPHYMGQFKMNQNQGR